jgi:hypothetical protein
MIPFLQLALPYLLVLYFVIRGIKQPIYWLAIPFLMFMSESIFFENAKLFNFPGRLHYALMLIWLGVLWIFSIIFNRDNDNELRNTQSLNVLDFFVMSLMILSFIGLGTALVGFSDLTDIVKEFVVIVSLFAAYFIIKLWISNNKPELLEKFLLSIVVVNTLAAILYILHQGLHIRIYQSEEYLTEVFAGEEITRTFWFMPQFLFFSIAFCMVMRKKRLFLYTTLLIINLLATFITYFRSFSIIAVLIFLSYFMLVGLKRGRLGVVIKNVFLFTLFAVLFFFMLLKIFPANTQYFLDRFSEITTPKLSNEPNNLDVRFSNTGIIISNIPDSKKLLGMGSVTENQLPWVSYMRLITADMVWTGVIFRWGFIGLIFFILLYVYGLVKAFFIFMKSDGIVADLSLIFMIYIFSQVIQSFIDWTFMSGHGFAIGLWYFAFVSALIGFNKNKELATEKTDG